MPSTHRRRRRDETVLSCRVSVGGVYMNSRRLPTDSAMRTHNAAVGRDPVHNCRRECSHRRHDETVANQYTPPTRRDSTVSSLRRRRCVLGLRASGLTLHWLYLPDSLLVIVRHWPTNLYQLWTSTLSLSYITGLSPVLQNVWQRYFSLICQRSIWKYWESSHYWLY